MSDQTPEKLGYPNPPDGTSARDFYWDMYRRHKILVLPHIEWTEDHCNGRKRGQKLANGKREFLGYCQLKPGTGTNHPGEGRCRHHSGNVLRGIAHPNFDPTLKRAWARNLPSRIGEAYQRALQDPELLRLRHEVAITDSRLDELYSSLSSLPPKEQLEYLKKQLRNLFSDLNNSTTVPNVDAIRLRVQHMLEAVESVDEGSEMWEEIGKWVDRRQRLVEAETRHMIQAKAMISTQELMILLQQLLVILRTRVDDKRVVAQIGADIVSLIPSMTVRETLKV